MKHITLLAILILLVGCKKETKETSTETSTEPAVTNTESVTKKIESKATKSVIEKATTNNSHAIAFLKDVTSLKNDTSKNPINAFKEQASKDAKKVIILSKDNIKSALEKAKSFKHAVITVNDHTIVKIIDLDNCKPSGAWASCMPEAEGYIKKGDLIYQKDYINNIIGLPDTQERSLYLF